MYRFKLKEIEVGDIEVKSGKQSTVTDIDDTTGTITWDVEDVADFSSTYKELEQAKNFLRDLEQTGKAKDDIALDKLADELSSIFNKFRTHIRKNYPEEYERVLRLKESDRGLSWTTSPTQTGARGTIDTHTKLPKLKEKEFYEVGDIVEFPYGYSTHTGIIRDVDKRGDENDPYNWDYTVQMRGDEYEPGSRNYHDDEWNGKISYPAGHKIYGIPTKYLDESVNEQSEQWTQLDIININKSLRLALKTFNNLVRNLERLEGELGKHSNKPQGNLLQGMAPDSFDYMGVQNKLNKLYNAFSNAFSIDESLNEGHGLDQVDLDYLQHIANKNPDDTKLEKIVQFLTKSNILVDKTKDLSKGKEVEEEKIKGADGKACWKGYRYAGTEDGKDKCIKVNEEDVEEGEGIGYLTPRAFGKIKNDVYTSQYGYKLVPKKIKGSGLEVKQLFEYSDFQEGRISGFDKVEEKVNAISTLLSNAKNETVKFYNENPGSYAVVYSTDMVNELLDDIAEMLKQSK